MNFKTMAEMRKEQDDDNKDNRESYVGGKKSGLAVEDRADITSKIMKQAKN